MNLKLEIEKYLPLQTNSEDEESSGLIHQTENNGPQLIGNQLKNKGFLLSFVVVLITSTAIAFILGWKLHPKYPDRFSDNTWDAVKPAISYHEQTFEPRFEEKNEYMGEPNDHLDDLWYELTAMRNLAADYNAIQKANKTKNIVQWPGTDKYQVTLEAFHQLHCLNYIRMYTFMDHYSQIDPDMKNETPEERFDHKGK
ncbi:hypothetical protein NHQ30_004021 [Ciborinia camelliae]|nr:hypothetical protein NHQ30_004021 [Ciborinia camelliae]